MKKAKFSFLALAALALVSCNKEDLDNATSDMLLEAVGAESMVTVSSSDYEMESENLQKSANNGTYTAGTITYTEDGELVERFDFGTDDENTCHREREGREEALRKHEDGAEFEKVIVNPIVKAEDCEERVPVAGTIELLKDGEWVATIDFGDGECDCEATKTTEEGTETFDACEAKKRHKKHRKGKKGDCNKDEEGDEDTTDEDEVASK